MLMSVVIDKDRDNIFNLEEFVSCTTDKKLKTIKFLYKNKSYVEYTNIKSGDVDDFHTSIIDMMYSINIDK